MNLFFENTKKHIIKTAEDEDFKIIKYCRFCGKSKISIEVIDHCHSTGKYRAPAHNKCNTNV